MYLIQVYSFDTHRTELFCHCLLVCSHLKKKMFKPNNQKKTKTDQRNKNKTKQQQQQNYKKKLKQNYRKQQHSGKDKNANEKAI